MYVDRNERFRPHCSGKMSSQKAVPHAYLLYGTSEVKTVENRKNNFRSANKKERNRNRLWFRIKFFLK
jgi:hypothetical protein